MSLPDSSILTNINFEGSAKQRNLLFEKKYITVRQIENRLYSDEEVERLPDIKSSHTHYHEWRIRKRSMQRLTGYFAAKKKRLDILDAGCGNGWLAHALSRIPGAEVTGMDVNFTELQQAARVFNHNQHLRFVYGDVSEGLPAASKFDIILFAASIQYFRSLRKLIHTCMQQLNANGEIHIIDSHFYRQIELEAARRRTEEYYFSLGFPEMSEYYHHHCINELQAFNHTILRNPRFMFHRFSANKNPFYWVCIKK
ncbi:MAG: class I SAM-dependent methyltransferase [Bacteroidetes bacterium]|nr:class I SAM-dependent methyltransferase [Bacteroidota bacterium]